MRTCGVFPVSPSQASSIMSETLSSLEQLRALSLLNLDTAELDEIRRLHPHDVTTNPSLLLKACRLPNYKDLLNKALSDPVAEDDVTLYDRIATTFGAAIVPLLPPGGFVSTEASARASYDTEATIEHARRLIKLYETKEGIDRSRILIKIAGTFEGIRAASVLEKEGIHCNITLVFSLVQAAAAAEAGATLISPFVGRVLDYYKRNTDAPFSDPRDDPGCQEVKTIYHYLRANSFTTILMGASFRNPLEVLELAGCERLTVSPAITDELSTMHVPVERKLSPEGCSHLKMHTHDFSHVEVRIKVDEKSFRQRLSENKMATELLAQGIESFARDQDALDAFAKEVKG